MLRQGWAFRYDAGVNVLLIGGGGREHAIAWKLRQSPRLTDLHIAPGNAGTAGLGHNLDLPLPRTTAPAAEIDSYKQAVVKAAMDLRIDLAFVAPDDPLSWGLVDALEAAGVPAFGPTKAAATLEASKSWAKQLMAGHGIPHTRTRVFDDPDAARAYVRSAGGPVVVKADGLAVGKGAIVTSTVDEALDAIDELSALGESGRILTVEDRITAREVSAHAFSDGHTIVPMPLSCDHKAVFDANQGPNTGGMGVYSPPWWADEGLGPTITGRVLQPLADAMAAADRAFKGIIYPGVFVNSEGLQVFECNARFGDPEAQALLVRLETDLLDIVDACVNGRLDEVDVRWSPWASVCVVMASGGYPGAYQTGLPITGVEDVDPDVVVFHAGTRRDDSGRLVTAGGRVLGVTATGDTLEAAREKAYANVGRIHFEGAHYRRDIGLQE
jgi:phosphoribosylamine--glycine ligase